MNAFTAFLSGALRSAWNGGYREQTRRAAIVAPLLVLCGFGAAMFVPSLRDSLLSTLLQAIDTVGVSEAEGMEAVSLLFSNNMTAAFSALLWGLVPFVYLSALPLGFNFFVLGVMGAYYVQSGVGLGAYLVGILPHGIFELPALVLFCAAGLYLCERMTARVRGDKSIRITLLLSEVSVIYLYVILPLLAMAALVESYVTPRLLALALG